MFSPLDSTETTTPSTLSSPPSTASPDHAISANQDHDRSHGEPEVETEDAEADADAEAYGDIDVDADGDADEDGDYQPTTARAPPRKAARSTSSSTTKTISPPDSDGKRRRSRTGCRTCRRRKVKCDEARPSCERCLASKLPCEGYGEAFVSMPRSSAATGSSSGAGASRRRTAGSRRASTAATGGARARGGGASSSSYSSINPEQTFSSLSLRSPPGAADFDNGDERRPKRGRSSASIAGLVDSDLSSSSAVHTPAESIYASTGSSSFSSSGMSSRSSSMSSIHRRRDSAATLVAVAPETAASIEQSLSSIREGEVLVSPNHRGRPDTVTPLAFGNSMNGMPGQLGDRAHAHPASGSASLASLVTGGLGNGSPEIAQQQLGVHSPQFSPFGQAQQHEHSPSQPFHLYAQVPAFLQDGQVIMAPAGSAFPSLNLPGISHIPGASPVIFPQNGPPNAGTPIDFDHLFAMSRMSGHSPTPTAGQVQGSSIDVDMPPSGDRPFAKGRERLTPVPNDDTTRAPRSEREQQLPPNYWDDQEFVDKMLQHWADASATSSPSGHTSPLVPSRPFAHADMQMGAASVMANPPARSMSMPQQRLSPSGNNASSSNTIAASNPARSNSIPMSEHLRDSGAALQTEQHPSAMQDTSGSPAKSTPVTLSTPSVSFQTLPSQPHQQPSPPDLTHAANATAQQQQQQQQFFNRSRHQAQQAVIFDYAHKPAVDPILQASSQVELHRRLIGRGSDRNKATVQNAIPSLEELELGPPPAHFPGSPREWSIPANIAEGIKNMENQRHAELLRHYFISTCPLFNTIDHPKNPFRTFVGQHALESLPLLHAVLALAAINQQPLSVETRAESLLYFEASVDLYVRSLQQEDDISLFTLLLLSLYYAFDSGTSQSQHFSRRAQSIINDRFELLGAEYLKAYPDFRFLVRLHVWYEVLANLACRPGELRDMAPGKYTLPYLIGIIEQWDAQEEKNAGLSGVNPDYSMLGLLGVPTFFIRLLCEITFLKEEQAALLGIDAENLDENGQQVKRALFAKHARKIRDLECKIQFARPGRLMLPPVVAAEAQVHRAVSVRFFDLFRLAASIHLLTELQAMSPRDRAIQLRVQEMVNLLSNIEQNSNYNTSGIWAFFVAGAAAQNAHDRGILHRRLDSTWNSPCGNVWSLRSVLDEVWQRNAEAEEAGEPAQGWKEIAHARGWTLLLM